MKNTKTYIMLFILLFWGVGISYSQVIIRPTALNSPFFKFEQLFQIQLMNTSPEAVRGVIQVRLEDNLSKNIFQINSLPITLAKGQNIQGNAINWEQGLDLSNQQLASTLNQYGRLVNGQYIYCYRFIDQSNGRTIGSFCQESAAINYQLPALIYPRNSQKITNPFPVLSWRAPIPLFGNELNYALRLVSLEKGQSPLDAINSNLPLLEKYRLKHLILPYPPTGIPLKKDQQYVWQVTAFWGEVEVGKTEIWQFSLVEPAVTLDKKIASYRLVKRQMGASFYVFSDREIFFGYDNYLADKKLKYTIYAKDDPKKIIADLPKVALASGLNQIILKLDPSLKLADKQAYILEIENSKGESFFLSFKYSKK